MLLQGLSAFDLVRWRPALVLEQAICTCRILFDIIISTDMADCANLTGFWCKAYLTWRQMNTTIAVHKPSASRLPL